jgi:multidrug efflux system outer membrane protein
MNRKTAHYTALLTALGLISGCSTTKPTEERAEEPIVALQWQVPANTSIAYADSAALESLDWNTFFTHSGLQKLIHIALENNRDLRVSVLNVERARALYRIQRADRLPSVSANGTLARSGGGNAVDVEEYRAELGLAQYEIDLFGRVKQLSREALHTYFAAEEAQLSARLTLITEVADAYLTYAADSQVLDLAKQSEEDYATQLEILQNRYDYGTASALELSQTQAALEASKASVATYTGQVNRDINALTVLLGQPVEASLLVDLPDMALTGTLQIPEGLPSEVLLRRPDIREAEQTLLAAEANLKAARLAFFPSISLTGAVGSASGDLSDLFSSGTDVWSFTPAIRIPIFQGGSLIASRDASKASRNISIANYEKAIQVGFQDVSDALTLRATSAQALEANRNRLKAMTDVLKMSETRYEAGEIDYYTLLDVRRDYYSARQSVIEIARDVESNNISLFRSLGGGFSSEVE